MSRLKKATVDRTSLCAYVIKSQDLKANNGVREKRRGFIIESVGEAVIIPFNKTDGNKRKSHEVRKTDAGSLRLSPSRQRITLTISFDREKDSMDAFKDAFEELTNNYIQDVLDFEINECLE